MELPKSLQGWKVFLRIFFPSLLFLLGTSVTSYVERIFLAQVSEGTLTGSLHGFFLASIFQYSALAVVMGGQTFIGLFYGSNQPRQIGPCVWQLIWFSLATIVIVPPLGFLLEHVLYHNTAVSQAESGYFSLLCWFNFLIPLAGALTAFYVGRRKVILTTCLTLGAVILNLGLDYIFIFGNEFIAPMGSYGASLAKVISQGLVCLILGFLFLRSKNHELFGTREWNFRPSLFTHYLKPGLFRALGAVFCLTDWSVVSSTMTLTSEHRLVYTIGVTIFYFFTFFADAIFQSIVTLTSTYIGEKKNDDIWKTVKNGLLMMGVYSVLLCIPFFVFPETLIYCFKAASFNDQMMSVMRAILPSLWFALIGYGLSATSLSLIVASRDTLFLCKYYSVFWLISSVPVYFLMVKFNFNPEIFWYLVFATNLVSATNQFRRASKQRWLREDWRPPSLQELLPSN